MRRPLLPLILAALPLAAMANEHLTLLLPDVSDLSPADAEALLTDIVAASVVSSNCPDFGGTEGEWYLLTLTAERLAYEVLAIRVEELELAYYQPAYSLIEDPATCAAEGPKVQKTLALLMERGGSTTPVPTNEAGVTE